MESRECLTATCERVIRCYDSIIQQSIDDVKYLQLKRMQLTQPAIAAAAACGLT